MVLWKSVFISALLANVLLVCLSILATHLANARLKVYQSSAGLELEEWLAGG